MTFDLALALIEVVVAVASLGLLVIVAVQRVGGRPRRLAITFAVVTALTAAEPFGLVATPASPRARPGDREVSPTAIHRAGLIFAFRVYRRPTFRVEGESGDPTHTLRLRTGLWPVILAHQHRLADLCGVVFNPCWDPRFEPKGLAVIKREDGGWTLIARTPYATGGRDLPPRPADVQATRAWDLAVGVVSLPSLAWCCAAAAAIVMAAVRRPAARTASAGPRS
jgi:hypothetical protein